MISGAIMVRTLKIENLNEYISCWMRTFKVHKMVLKMVLNIACLSHKVLKTVSQREPFLSTFKRTFFNSWEPFWWWKLHEKGSQKVLKMFSKRFSKGFSNKVLKTVSQREPFLRTIMSTSLFQWIDYNRDNVSFFNHTRFTSLTSHALFSGCVLPWI